MTMLMVPAVLVLACVCLVQVAQGQTQSPRVRVAQGLLRGTTLTTRGGRQIHAFLGVPYAAPPIGNLRFQSPQPPAAWADERDASKEGSICLQQFVLIEKLRDTVMGDEDCLYLNVFTPKVSKTEKMPVMFYIHGGGYAGGSGAMENYGPELLLDKDVVLVAVNYRLGPLGFLSTGDSVVPGNMGLKDQNAALRWVQENIEEFGGDKNSVTIFGESAGGGSVHFHMLSPRSKGLFHAAVSHSGNALCPWAFSTAARHRMLAGRLAQLLNCPPQPSLALRDCLLKLPADHIVSALQHFIVWDMDPVVLFNPALEPEEVEDAFLTQDPWTLSSDVPWMVGYNEFEGVLKIASLTRGDVKGKFQQLNEDFSSILPMSLLYQHTAQDPDKVTQAIKQFYFGDAEKLTLENVPQMINMYTDAWFGIGTHEAARRHKGPVFVYFFTYNSSFSLCNEYFDNPEYMGVCHFDELLYLFPMEGHAPRLIENDPDYLMSKDMVELWTKFAKTKVPDLGESRKLWDSANGSAEKYMLISKDGIEIQKDLLPERSQFWEKLPFRTKPQVDSKQTKLSDEF